MAIRVVPTQLKDVLLIETDVFPDNRGYFKEVYHAGRYEAHGIRGPFVQDNLSYSGKGVIRGLHYQLRHPQAKLVSVSKGRILDVAVDARRGSPTYGQHVSAELDAEHGVQIYVPAGFLHGYVTRVPDTVVQYKVSDVYAPDCDGGVLWNDPDLGIDWGIGASEAQLSAKDIAAQRFADFKSPF